jgi:hypothetical protein
MPNPIIKHQDSHEKIMNRISCFEIKPQGNTFARPTIPADFQLKEDDQESSQYNNSPWK